MRPINEDVLTEVENVAAEGLKHIRALFTYEGGEQRYETKAKVAIATLGAYGRLRSSETNRMAIELAAERAFGARRELAESSEG